MPSNTVLDPSEVDITSAEFEADPFPFYAWMRDNQPVGRVGAGRRFGQAWLVSRYDDAQAVLRDDRFLKNARDAMTREQARRSPTIPNIGPFKVLQHGLLTVDPPDHTRLRQLVNKAFTPRLVENMREQIQAIADDLLDACVQQGSVDLLAAYATPLPLRAISRILGVPDDDATRFHRWWQTFLSASNSGNAIRVTAALWSMVRFMRGLVRQRTAAPREDVVSALAMATEVDDQLDEDEVLAMIFLLLSAGHETTVNLIGSGLLALLDNPDQLALLRDDPSVGPSAVEELVRYVAPVETASERYPREDVGVRGVRIPRGELTLVGIASANRDPSIFERPDELDLRRSPNPHLSFGKGIHYCLGAAMARLEGQVGLATLLRRAPDVALAVPRDQLRWRSSFVVRGLETLPVDLGTQR